MSLPIQLYASRLSYQPTALTGAAEFCHPASNPNQVITPFTPSAVNYVLCPEFIFLFTRTQSEDRNNRTQLNKNHQRLQWSEEVSENKGLRSEAAVERHQSSQLSSLWWKRSGILFTLNKKLCFIFNFLSQLLNKNLPTSYIFVGHSKRTFLLQGYHRNILKLWLKC